MTLRTTPTKRALSLSLSLTRRISTHPSTSASTHLLPRQPGARVGLKPVYLPNLTLTLLRTPFLPPTYATFLTPLSLNKLDLKSYLLNAYSLPTLSIRSFIQQQPVRQDKPDAKLPKARKWFRPRAIKKMTVEMERPFVWPVEIEDFSAWDKDRFEGARKAQEDERKGAQLGMMGGVGGMTAGERRERVVVRGQADRLLGGEERWVPEGQAEGVVNTDEEGWEEVETDVKG